MSDNISVLPTGNNGDGFLGNGLGSGLVGGPIGGMLFGGGGCSHIPSQLVLVRTKYYMSTKSTTKAH